MTDRAPDPLAPSQVPDELPPDRPAPPATCSAKGCTEPALWDLRGNNPKLHTPDRRKIWLACEAHLGSLSDFLGARGFLKDVVPHSGD